MVLVNGSVNRIVAIVSSISLLGFALTSVAYAEQPSPAQAAMLNAGTAYTGIGPAGYVGAGISAVVPQGAPDDVEVAGVLLGSITSDDVPTRSTSGSPAHAALLNAGTALTGMGESDGVGAGIVAVAVVRTAGSVLDFFAPSGYVERIRQWHSEGHRVQPGQVALFALARSDSVMGAVEVAGVPVKPDGSTTYAERLRHFSGDGYRVPPNRVDPAALVNR